MNSQQKKIRIIAIVAAIALALFAMYFIFSSPYDAINDAEKRTENEFVTKKYKIDEVWYRELKSNASLRYVFIKPQNVNINLSFGMDKIFPKNKDEEYEAFASQFKQGDEIEVKLYEPEITEAEKGGVIKKIKNFFANNNNEVEIYNLKLNGTEIYKQDIHNTAVNFRSGGDLSASNIMLLFYAIIPIAAIIGYIKRKKQQRNQVQ